MSGTPTTPRNALHEWLRDYFPHARLEDATGDEAFARIEILTPTRRYRLHIDATMLAEWTGPALVAHCQAHAVQWRLADAGEIRVTHTGADRPPPGDGRD